MQLLEQPSSVQPGMTKIAIVGGGFSGAMVAIHLLKNSTGFLEIQLIDRSATFGKGMAYGVTDNCFVLNVPAGKMSAFPDDPDHFLRWLQTQNNHPDSFTASSFVSRKLYGEYIQANLEEAIANSGNHLEKIEAEVIDLKIFNNSETQRAILTLNTGRIVEANKVILALGNLPPSDPPVADRSFYSSQRYIRNVWSANAFNAIAPDESVLLIGTGLTMVDVAIALHEQGHLGSIQAISRHGLLPLSHQSVSPLPPFQLTQESRQNIRFLMKQIRQHIQSAAPGTDWRSVIDSLRSQTQFLWENFPLSEKQRFLRHLRPYWEIHRHRLAPHIYEMIANLLHSQQLIIHAGRIQSYQEDSEKVTVTIQERSTKNFITVRANTIINCTGPECNYSKSKNLLINSLLASGEICPDPLFLGLSVNPQGAIINAKGVRSQVLHTLGSPKKGQLWETTAVPEIRQQAIVLARELLVSSQWSVVSGQ